MVASSPPAATAPLDTHALSIGQRICGASFLFSFFLLSLLSSFLAFFLSCLHSCVLSIMCLFFVHSVCTMSR